MVSSGEMWVEGRDKSGIGDDHIHTDSVGSSVVSTLWDAMDCSLPGFSVPGILQARMLDRGCHFLLQGIFSTQGWNSGLLLGR